MLQDIRYGLRALWKRPGFTVVVVLTLALGIGANTAIFSVVHAVLLRALPFPDPEQLVLVRDDLTGRKVENVGMSVDELRDLQERADVFDQVSALWPVDANLTGSDRPERIELLCVSPNYFSLLGAKARMGRILGPEDRAAGFAEGVVISDGLWRRLFAADPNVLGRKIRADNDMYTIVGVMPPDFRHPGRTLRNDVDVWATAGFAANPFGPPVRAARMLPGAIGRLKTGLSIEQAQKKIDALVTTLKQEFPNEYPAAGGWRVTLLPAHDTLVNTVRTTLVLLLSAVGLVLVIACVNIANLLLARSSARQREMAIRLAIGAGRPRLIRQLVTESLLLAVLGGAVALLMQAWVMKLLLGFIPSDIPRLNEVGLSGGVLLFAAAVSIVTGLLFGLFPAFQASRPDIVTTVKEGTAGAGMGARHHRFRSTLVIVEFALCLVLMIGAGLLLRSFGRLLDVRPGFDPQHVLLARIWLPVPNNPDLDPYRPPAKRTEFVKDVLRRISALPGVKFAATSSGNGVPLIGPFGLGAFTIEGEPADDNNLPRAQVSSVTPDFFRVLSTPLVRGRFFTDGDNREAPPVVLINEAMAARFWPNGGALGGRIRFGNSQSRNAWMTVAGVVGNIKTDGVDRPDQPQIYTSMLVNAGYAMAIYVHTEGDPASFTQAVRQQVQAVDPDLPVFGEQPMTSLLSASLAQRRFAMQAVGIFGALALGLAGIGIYGVMAYSVSQRTREIGIRIALGASRGAILRWVLTQGLRLTLAGVGAGLLGALLLTRLLRGMLFGVAPTDPLTYLGLAIVLAGVALIACYIPARRATRVDPMVATTQ
jgi:putative ABC transport system permease protein